jgi:hypothetical protein
MNEECGTTNQEIEKVGFVRECDVTTGRAYTEGTSEQEAEKNIWT